MGTGRAVGLEQRAGQVVEQPADAGAHPDRIGAPALDPDELLGAAPLQAAGHRVKRTHPSHSCRASWHPASRPSPRPRVIELFRQSPEPWRKLLFATYSSAPPAKMSERLLAWVTYRSR